jgi:hypothetical protein
LQTNNFPRYNIYRYYNTGSTYVQWFSEEDPARLRLNVKIVEIVPLEGGGQAVPDRPVIVRILVAGRHAQYIRPNVGVLLHVLDVLLPVEQRRVVVDVRDLDGEGADALQRGLAGVDGLDSDGDAFAVVALAIKDLVGEQLACLLVNSELGAWKKEKRFASKKCIVSFKISKVL